MLSRIRQAFQWIFLLELYEVIGIIVSALAMGVFVVFARRLDAILGIRGYHWLVIDDVIGMYENVIPWVFTVALGALFLLWSVLRRTNHDLLQKFAYLVRILIAFCVMMAIYKIVNFYISVFNPFDKDMVLQHIDRALFFGKLPSEWLEPLISKPLTIISSISYMSWFAFTYFTIILMMSHSRRATMEYVFTAMFTFYVGYVTYLLVPAIGPAFTVHFAQNIGGLTRWFTSSQALVARDCFPSLHTGISIVMFVHVWKYRRRWVWLYAPAALLIVFSTLYLRFHYGIDVIAGTGLALTTLQLGPMFVSAWERTRQSRITVPAPVRDGFAVSASTSVSELA